MNKSIWTSGELLGTVEKAAWIQNLSAYGFQETFKWLSRNHTRLREITYPFPKACLKMIFFFPRWDMLVPWRVALANLSIQLTSSCRIESLGAETERARLLELPQNSIILDKWYIHSSFFPGKPYFTFISKVLSWKYHPFLKKTTAQCKVMHLSNDSQLHPVVFGNFPGGDGWSIWGSWYFARPPTCELFNLLVPILRQLECLGVDSWHVVQHVLPQCPSLNKTTSCLLLQIGVDFYTGVYPRWDSLQISNVPHKTHKLYGFISCW